MCVCIYIYIYIYIYNDVPSSIFAKGRISSLSPLIREGQSLFGTNNFTWTKHTDNSPTTSITHKKLKT